MPQPPNTSSLKPLTVAFGRPYAVFGKGASRQLRSKHSVSGAMLLEAAFTIGIVSIFLSGMFSMNSRILGLVNSTKESAFTQQAVCDRLEKMRSASWDSLTNPVHIRDTVLASNANLFPLLRGGVISITVASYLPNRTGAATRIVVERSANGTVSILEAGDGRMNLENAARVEVTATWPARNGVTRTQQAVTVIGKNGIAGRRR